MELNTFNLIIQIIANVFIVGGGIFAIYQYRNSKKVEEYQYHKDRIYLAIDIAKYYKENILVHSRSLKQLIESIGLLDITENIKIDTIEFFDIDELEYVYTKKNLEEIKLKRQQYSIDFNVSERSIAYRSASPELSHSQTNHLTESEECKEIGSNYVNMMFNILNDLEIFSMYFVHEAADESVVYQPLHMSFLEIVRMLYYDISYANRDGEKRFYVNIIKLYNIWKKKALEQHQKELDSKRNIAEEGNVLHK